MQLHSKAKSLKLYASILQYYDGQFAQGISCAWNPSKLLTAFCRCMTAENAHQTVSFILTSARN